MWVFFGFSISLLHTPNIIFVQIVGNRSQRLYCHVLAMLVKQAFMVPLYGEHSMKRIFVEQFYIFEINFPCMAKSYRSKEGKHAISSYFLDDWSWKNIFPINNICGRIFLRLALQAYLIFTHNILTFHQQSLFSITLFYIKK